MPFDVAFSIDARQRTAWSIIFSEQNTGKKYDFNTESFEDAK